MSEEMHHCTVCALFGKAACSIHGVRKQAHFDCGEVHLSEIGQNGEITEELGWPIHWPETVTPDFVRGQGYEVV